MICFNNAQLDRSDMKTLIKGMMAPLSLWNSPLIQKAGFRYSDQYGRFNWDNLDRMTDEELCQIYSLCKSRNS